MTCAPELARVAFRLRCVRLANLATSREERIRWMRLHASVTPTRQLALPL